VVTFRRNQVVNISGISNETAGDHFTAREAIRLIVNLVFIHDDDLLTIPGTVRRMQDPACGTFVKIHLKIAKKVI
jgi:type I restriction enzyme M protein